MKKPKDLTYDDAAKVLNCSPRHVRNLLQKHRIKPKRLGYRTVRIPADKIVKLKLSLLPA